MRSWFIRISLLVCLAASLTGQTNEWRRYRNIDGNFSALMPTEPTDSPNGDQDASPSHTIQAIDGTVGYTVVYVISKDDQPVNEATFNVYRDAFLKGLPQCEMIKEASASPEIQGYIGHWYRMNCHVGDQPVSFIGNLYWGKHYAYAVLTMFKTEPSDPPGARRFSDSFSVIDAAK